MATMRSRFSRGSAMLAVVAVAAPMLAACTPRSAFASLENRTGSDVIVLSPWLERIGRVPAAEVSSVEVGRVGDCLPELLVITADHRRITRVPGPICEHDDVVVEEEQLALTGTALVQNATGRAFSRGSVGSFEFAALGVGDELEVFLDVGAGGCVETWVWLIARDSDGTAIAEAELPDWTSLCDGDVVVLEPWTVKEFDGVDWVRIAPSPAPRPSPAATVTMLNSTDVEIQAWVGMLESMPLAPGESGELSLRAAAEECAVVRLRADVAGLQLPVQSEIVEVCDGDTAVVTTEGISVLGPNGPKQP